MLSKESNTSSSWGGWLKWLVNTGIALLAASGSVVAILQYLHGPDVSPAPAPYSPASLISTPRPEATSILAQVSPTAVPPSVTPTRPDPTDFILAYWQHVSDGRYESAWEQLSPRFRQAGHQNDYFSYVAGYQGMNLCRITISGVRLILQDSTSAALQAHVTYYTGAACQTSEYDFEMWLVYIPGANSWLFDKNIVR